MTDNDKINFMYRSLMNIFGGKEVVVNETTNPPVAHVDINGEPFYFSVVPFHILELSEIFEQTGGNHNYNEYTYKLTGLWQKLEPHMYEDVKEIIDEFTFINRNNIIDDLLS